MQPKRVGLLVVAVTVVGAGGGWAAASSIKSPAQIAAERKAPAASAITVPVEKRVLVANLITRGTVTHNVPQKVVLPTSALKSGAGVVTAVPDRGLNLKEGTIVMAIGARPVIALKGSTPMYRDLGIGSTGDDVRQLQESLVRLGFVPGRVDGVYDLGTSRTVAAWYAALGQIPFQPTEAQRLALKSSKDAVTQAQDRVFSSQKDLDGAILQALSDQNSADGSVSAAQVRVDQARSLVGPADAGVASAIAAQRSAVASAAVDVKTQQGVVADALAAQQVAVARLASPPPGATASVLQAELDSANRALSLAQDKLAAAVLGSTAADTAAAASVTKAKNDAEQARLDVDRATSDLTRARDQSASARQRVSALPSSTTSSGARALESANVAFKVAQSDFAALDAKTGVQIPADEILFFSDFPLRVDEVKLKRGDLVTGDVLTVTGSNLVVDATLSPIDVKLVKAGIAAKIEEPSLQLSTSATLTEVAAQPGTKGAEPQRFFIELTPQANMSTELIGASVRITIGIKATSSEVLAVPLSALTVGADGTSRLEVVASSGGRRFVKVTPGLAAQGLVEVTSLGDALSVGDEVVVGNLGAAAAPAPVSPSTGASVASSSTTVVSTTKAGG